MLAIHVAGILTNVGGVAALIGLAIAGPVDLLDLLAALFVAGHNVGMSQLAAARSRQYFRGPAGVLAGSFGSFLPGHDGNNVRSGRPFRRSADGGDGGISGQI